MRNVEPVGEVGGLAPAMPISPRQRIPGCSARASLARFAATSPLGASCAAFLLVVVLVAIFEDQLIPSDPLENNYSVVSMPPYAAHLLGTDQVGRDVLSRLILGTRMSLLVAVTAVVVGDGL